MVTYAIAFVVALTVVAVAAQLWITSYLGQRLRALELSHSMTAKSLRIDVDKLAEKRSESPTASLAVKVDDLAAAVDELSQRHRRFAGKVWGRLGHVEAAEPKPPETPEQVRDRLRAEHGLPKVGRPTNGSE